MKTVCLLVVASIVLYSAAAFAQTFSVSNATDFQAALTTAQSNNEDDVINVAAGTYTVNSTLTYKTDTGDSGHTLTIQGAGAGSTVLDGGVTVQIMYINTDTGHDGGDSGGDVTVSGITFQYGANSDQGAGCDIETTDASITMTDNIFSNNTSVYRGGGAVLYSSGPGLITLTNNTFNDNQTTDPSDGGGGGADISTDSGLLTASNNTFLTNQSVQGGGGNFASGSGTIDLDSNIFRDNTASVGSAGGGGAALVTNSGDMTLTNNIFSINSVSDNSGGGASIWRAAAGGVITLTNNTFYKNECTGTGWYGGGAYIAQQLNGMVVKVYNNIFWENASLSALGNDLYIDDLPVIFVSLYNNDFSGNANFVTGNSAGLYIDGTSNYTHGSNIQLDPLFVDSANGDFHLSAGASPSPCINMGTNGAPSLPSTDFEGDPRIMPTGGTVDIGADEVATKTAISSSRNPSTYNQSVTFTATVTSPSGTPTGTVTFEDGSTVICSDVILSLVGGVEQAQCTTSTLTVGNHTITAVYGGDASSNYPGSSGTLTQKVVIAATVAVPAMDGFGMILFILFAGLGSILSIRRRKRAYSNNA